MIGWHLRSDISEYASHDQQSILSAVKRLVMRLSDGLSDIMREDQTLEVKHNRMP